MGNSVTPVFSRRAVSKALAGIPLAFCGMPQTAVAGAADDCRRNLHAIHDAVAQFRKRYGRLPASLSALLAEGLINQRLLICPVRLAGGRATSGFSAGGRRRDDPATSYKWVYADASDRLASDDFLERQRRMGAGDWIPLVRCDSHAADGGLTHLNLAMNGGIYPSGSEWEPQLREIIPYPYLRAVAIIEAEPLIPLNRRMPPRSRASGPRQIDLGEAFNSALTDPWPEGYPGEEAPELLALGGERRIIQHGGISFELRGVVQLEGSGAAALRAEVKEARFPASRRVKLAGQATAVHLLCGVIKSQPPGTPALSVSLLSGNGAVSEMILRHGVHVAHGSELIDPRNAAIAWSRVTPPKLFAKVAPREPSAALSVSHVILRLEKPALLREMRFSALDSACYPFLLAITLE